MRNSFWGIVITALLITFPGIAHAQDSITLTVSGVAPTKDEATKQALRSAIEQAYGVFVSSNTSILNDELVKDEIVSISQGNILNYNVLSSTTLHSGLIDVQLQATVSISKLTTYAKSKGASAELAGGTFGMNMRLHEANKRNEKKALWDLHDMLMSIPTPFDYRMEVKGPFAPEGSYAGCNGYTVKIYVYVYPNENTQILYDTFYKTINAIGMPGKRYITNSSGTYAVNTVLQNHSSQQNALEGSSVELFETGDYTDNQESSIVFRNRPTDGDMPNFFEAVGGPSGTTYLYSFNINNLIREILNNLTIADNISYPNPSKLIETRNFDIGYEYNYTSASRKGCRKLNRNKPLNHTEGKDLCIEFSLLIPKEDIAKYSNFTVIEP